MVAVTLYKTDNVTKPEQPHESKGRAEDAAVEHHFTPKAWRAVTDGDIMETLRSCVKTLPSARAVKCSRL